MSISKPLVDAFMAIPDNNKAEAFVNFVASVIASTDAAEANWRHVCKTVEAAIKQKRAAT